MKICDPIHGYIHFNKEERLLINNPFLQRLQWIQQLGFVHYAYPAGVSNRYIHSLGACDLAGKVFDSIFSKESIKKLGISSKKQQEFKKIVKVAGLLHDIGHGPLSHTSEHFMPQLKDLKVPTISSHQAKARHEDYTVKMILESSLKDDLKEIGVEPLPLLYLIHSEVKKREGEDFFVEKGVNFLPLFQQIISSDLDVDRMDYLQRDSYFCGVKYGEFDFYWMISQFNAYIKEGAAYLAINREALYTAESFLLSRYYMHSTVYYHHKPIIYEQMLKRALDGWLLPTEVEEYRKVLDRDIFNLLQNKSDNEWAQRVLNQKPYKHLYEFSEKEEEPEEIKKSLEQNNISYIETRSLKNSVKPVKRKSNKHSIFIKNSFSEKVSSLDEKTEALLKHHKQNIHRIYTSPEDFERAKKIIL